jgi:uncharacterized membrane protein
MKSIISSLVILGIGATLLSADRSIAQSSKIEEFNVVGTEPFWNINISRKGIVYQAMGEKPQKFAYSAPLSAQARPVDKVRVYRFGWKNNNILMLNKVGNCSDGMSDKKYPYAAILMMGNRVVEGCAEKKSQ